MSSKKIEFSVYAKTIECIEEIKNVTKEILAEHFEPKIFQDLFTALDFLTYGQVSSRLFIIENKNDLESLSKVVTQIHNDPWLHGTIILVITDRINQNEMQELLNLGVTDFIQKNEIKLKLPTILQIANSNLDLFESEQFLLETITNKRGKLFLKNDLRLVPKATSQIMNLCYIAGFRDREAFSRISLSLHEMISNAIEHGNLGIGFNEKSKILEDTMDIYLEVDKRSKQIENKYKRVRVDFEINHEHAKFTVKDQGCGFDLASIPSPKKEENMLQIHGRGIMMTKNFVDEMEYNKKGNEVKLFFLNDNEVKRRANHLLQFTTGEIVFLSSDEILFEAGSESDYFYYILSGKLGVYVEEKLIATLTNEDMFVGEMSFLHHNIRTGTVKAETKSQLLPISRSAFIDMSKKYPYFGVFLARLLTKRLVKRNKNLM
jgi:hypothetical protein